MEGKHEWRCQFQFKALVEISKATIRTQPTDAESTRTVVPKPQWYQDIGSSIAVPNRKSYRKQTQQNDHENH